MNDSLTFTGDVIITLYDENKEIKEQRTIKNLVVTVGKNFIASRMASNASSVMGWIAVGTNNASTTVGMTALTTEIFRSATTVSGGTAASNTVTYETLLGPGQGTGSLVEAGIFNNSSGGTMLARTTFATIVKGASDSLNVSWTITLS